MFKPGKNPKNNNYAIDDYYPIHENALRILVIILIVAATGFLVINFLDGQIQVVFLTLFFITLMIVSFLLLQVGNTTVPKIMLPTTLFITCSIRLKRMSSFTRTTIISPGCPGSPAAVLPARRG